MPYYVPLRSYIYATHSYTMHIHSDLVDGTLISRAAVLWKINVILSSQYCVLLTEFVH